MNEFISSDFDSNFDNYSVFSDSTMIDELSKIEGMDVECEEVSRKIILLLGKSGMGKTTMLRTLIDPSYISEAEKGTRDTKLPSCYELSIKNPIHNNRINLTIMDTPGFFERAESDLGERHNDQLKNILSDSLEINISQINMIFICIKYGERLSDEMIETIEIIEALAGEDLRGNLGLILTKCETRERLLDNYVTELRSNHKTSRVMDYIGNRVYYFGANDHALMKSYEEFPDDYLGAKKRMNLSVRSLRNRFVISLFKLPEPSRSTNMQIVKDKVKETHKKIINDAIEDVKERLEIEKNEKLKELILKSEVEIEESKREVKDVLSKRDELVGELYHVKEKLNKERSRLIGRAACQQS